MGLRKSFPPAPEGKNDEQLACHCHEAREDVAYAFKINRFWMAVPEGFFPRENRAASRGSLSKPPPGVFPSRNGACYFLILSQSAFRPIRRRSEARALLPPA